MFGDNNNGYFIKDSHNKTAVILPQSEYLVNFKFDGIITKKTCYIAAEKDHREFIQLRISEKDLRKMYISNINMDFFDVLKLNQSLHVTYSGFIENLLKLLKECHKGNLQMSLFRDSNNGISLQFYEVHTFKNLTHLSLPFEEAPMEVINFYLHGMVNELLKQKNTFENIIQDLRRETKNAHDEISMLKKNNMKFMEEMSEQKQNFLKRRKNELEEMQENIKKLTDSKEMDEILYKKNIAQLQSRLDLLAQEKNNAFIEKGNELKRYEVVRKENLNLKSNICKLKKASEKLSQELSSFQNHEQQFKLEINNLNRKINENNEKISKLHKTKSELEAELEAEKKICQTKRNALTMATEEISKANEIITKQSNEITKHKKTIDWRTEVALQQELSIKEKEKTILYQNHKIADMYDELKSLKKETIEFPNKLKTIQQLTDSIENKYTKQIADLKKNLKM